MALRISHKVTDYSSFNKVLEKHILKILTFLECQTINYR
ncbi:MAG: hypothetical protein ACI81G_000645, partial [Gammaproteobacteria bacterium]